MLTFPRMVILGLVASVAGTGKTLKDGSAAVLADGRLLCAVAEERLTRIKRAGGWERSAAYCLEAAGLTHSDVDVVAYSTCCDTLDDIPQDVESMVAAFPQAQVLRVPHHLSHALYAFHGSPFERALVVVSDAGGNALEPSRNGWWSVRREQTTYFDVDDRRWRLLGRDFEQPCAAGFGETFRAMTYYLGWNGSRHTNKTMALSAYGDAAALGLSPFFWLPAPASGISSSVVNDPFAPVAMIDRAFDGRLASLVPPRAAGQPPEGSGREHLAALLQSSFQDVLAARVSEMCRRHGLVNVCMSGGVAYNCHANAYIAGQEAVGDVSVPPSPGDTGQSIGNAIWAHRTLTGSPVDRRSIADPYTGRHYQAPAGWGLSLPSGLVSMTSPLPSTVTVSHLVASGLVVGHFHGRSEIGARALGHRSIFADPRRGSVVDSLNRRKGRERIMPFGGSILTEEIDRLFTGVIDTPYMQFILRARGEGRRRLPAIVHVDGSSRLQSVDHAAGSPWLRSMLQDFQRIAGVGVVLNTSLNGPGEPIVERPEEAVQLARSRVIDCLVLEDTIVVPDETAKQAALSGVLAATT